MNAKFLIVNRADWERSVYFDYYYEQIKCRYTLQANIDITSLVTFQKNERFKFFPLMLYAIIRGVNENRAFRMSFKDGELGYWDEVVPSYTVFHPEDHTFTDIWSSYDSRLEVFYRQVIDDIDTYGSIKGKIKARPSQPPNFCPISCLPWLSFTGFSQDSLRDSQLLFPLIKFGKYFMQDKVIKLPLSVSVHHAVADGYHTCKLINDIEAIADQCTLK